MQKLLITGASGFLGWNLCQVAAVNWEVYGTYFSRPVNLPGITPLHIDLKNFQDLKTLFQTVRPDAVIHLAAEANLNRCQEQPETSHLLNVTLARTVAGLCADSEIPCAFSSTDQVFNGLNPPYRETDPVCPINRYGEQKALAEVEMQSCYPAIAICRMPLMFGAVPPTASSFLQPFIQTLKEGRELNLFVDEIRTPVSGTTAAKGLLLALQQVHGLIHLGGKERISRYDFGRLMVEVLELPAAGLKASHQQDVKMAAPRPPDVSLDSSRAFELGYAPPSLREELEGIRDGG
jgi:dTDP-4-dehydrorhamnose reductase